ncbi:FHA domain-containing protein [Streptosporangium sp. NPDC023963]|uniref:FHA domain-containing protein n=1 Tax=Streptosporangium sp. NPDC023963 TaxID=3155608 RepID=UPI003435D582
MTDQGFGVVRPLPGNGLVAHEGGLLLVCDAAEAVVEDLLGALRETAASGGDGRALARRVAQILAVMMGEPVACAVAGPVSGGVAVLVSGPAFASVTGANGEIQLAGRDALTWSDRLVPGPVTQVELRLPDAGDAHPLSRLDAGVIVAGGVRCDPTEAGAAPRAVPRTESAAPQGQHAQQNVQQAAPRMEPAVPAPTPMPAPPERSTPPEWSAPPEAAPPAPYPMGPAEPYPPVAPPVEPRREPQPQGWHSEPMPAASPQGPLSSPGHPGGHSGGPSTGPAPSVVHHEDIDTAMASGMGGDPIDVRDQPFEYELLTPGGSQPGNEPSGPAAEPEARPLVYGVDCKNDHFNDPRVPYCAVCGIALVQRTLVPYKGPRPPLGVLLLDDGMTLRLDTDYLVGRDPERAPEVADGSVRPAKVTSPDGSVSRRHLRVALDGWDVNLVDLGSVNGTQIQPPGDPNFYDIPPNEPVAILPGTTVRIGVSRTMRYESHRNR